MRLVPQREFCCDSIDINYMKSYYDNVNCLQNIYKQ